MKLKEVGMKKALESLGATDIKINRKAYWHVSGSFTLNGTRFKYASYDLRACTMPGSDDIDLHGLAPLYYHAIRPNGTPGQNMFDLNERLEQIGLRVPLYKHDYLPWLSLKKTVMKTQKHNK